MNELPIAVTLHKPLRSTVRNEVQAGRQCRSPKETGHMLTLLLRGFVLAGPNLIFRRSCRLRRRRRSRPLLLDVTASSALLRRHCSRCHCSRCHCSDGSKREIKKKKPKKINLRSFFVILIPPRFAFALICFFLTFVVDFPLSVSSLPASSPRFVLTSC